MHREGVKLVGELVPYLQGWQHAGCDYGSEALTEILARAGEYGMIVSYHTMPEWPEQTEVMVGNCPGVTFVAAHPGQKADYLLHVERMKKFPNLNLDISGTGLFRYGLLAALAQTYCSGTPGGFSESDAGRIKPCQGISGPGRSRRWRNA